MWLAYNLFHSSFKDTKQNVVMCLLSWWVTQELVIALSQTK